MYEADGAGGAEETGAKPSKEAETKPEQATKGEERKPEAKYTEEKLKARIQALLFYLKHLRG